MTEKTSPSSTNETQFPASALAEKIGKVREFIRTTFNILTRPRSFFTTLFRAIDQPAKEKHPTSLSKFKYLGISIAISAAVMPLHFALLRTGNFPEYFIDLAERGSQGLAQNYKKMSGRDIVLIDFSNLTGVSLIDSSIEDTARMLVYALIAGLFWIFSGGKLPIKRMMGYFAYSFGACLVIETAFLLIADVIFVQLAYADSGTAMFALSTIQQLGSIPRLVYLFILPAVILPAILSIRRGTIIWATILSALTWGVVGLLFAYIMMGIGVVILLPNP